MRRPTRAVAQLPRRPEFPCGQPTAFTPGPGWEKVQVENQVGVVRERFFQPRLRFSNIGAMKRGCWHSALPVKLQRVGHRPARWRRTSTRRDIQLVINQGPHQPVWFLRQT